MKKILENPPLVHVSIHLRFSSIPALKDMEADLQKRLHESMMKEGFVDKILSNSEQLDFAFDAVTQQMRYRKLTAQRTLFRNAGEISIVEISEDSFILKTTKYSNFEGFYDVFTKLLAILIEIIPNFDKSLMKSIGLRYVDVIVPTKKHNLIDFVNPEVLPPSLNNEGEHIQGNTLKVSKVNENQFLVVNFEELPVHENKVYKVLPDNLIEPDKNCGLVIAGNKDWLKVNAKTYGLLDTDHTFIFSNSPVINTKEVNEKLKELYKKSKNVFWNTITNEAKKTWGVKDKEA